MAQISGLLHGKLFYLHKFIKFWLSYEVALCILSEDIVWINGPYEAGIWPDISIYQNLLKSHLGVNERVEVNDGYAGEAPLTVKCLRNSVNPQETVYMQAQIYNRQETVTKTFKDWEALKQVY